MASLVPQRYLFTQIKFRNWIILGVVLGFFFINLLIWMSIYVPLKDLQKRASLSKDDFDKVKKEILSFREEQRDSERMMIRNMMDFQNKILSQLHDGDQFGNSKNGLVPQKFNKLDQLIALLQEKMDSSDVTLRKQQEGMERLYELSQNYRKDIVTELIELKAFRQEYQKELQQLKEQSQEAWRQLGALRELNGTIQQLKAGSAERMLQENTCERGLGCLESMDHSSLVLEQPHADTTSEHLNKESTDSLEVEEKGATKLIQKGVKKAKKVFEGVVSFFGGKLGFKKNSEEESSSEEGFRISIPDPELSEFPEEIQVGIKLEGDESNEQPKKREQENEFMLKFKQLVGVSQSFHKGGDLAPERMLTFLAYLEAKFEDINTWLEDHSTFLVASDDRLRKEYEALQQSFLSSRKSFDVYHGFSQKPSKLNKQWKKFFSKTRDLSILFETRN